MVGLEAPLPYLVGLSDADVTALVSELTPAGTFPADYVKSIEDRVPCVSAVILSGA